MALERIVNTAELTTPQKGVVCGLVCLGHYLVMWGLLWVKTPQLPSTPVTGIQVEWIELATLASATPNQDKSINTHTASDLTDNVKSSQTPKLEPKTEPKIPKSAPKTAPDTRKMQPQPTSTPKLQPKLKSKPKLEPQIQIANTAIKNSQQEDSKTNARDHNNPNQDKDTDKDKDRDKDRGEPKTHNTPPAASNNNDNEGREKGEKSKKGDNSISTNPSSQDVGMGNSAKNNVGNQDSLKPAKSNALEQNWSTQVRSKLQRSLNYPDEALSKKWSGKPTLSITIDKAGNVLSVSVVKSSGKAILDKEAIATARRASPLPAPPDEIMNGQGRKSFSIPVRFNLKSQ